MRLVALAAALVALALPAGAGAFVYWANTGSTIGRANLDGSGANSNFLASGQACGVAVDSSYIYWTGNANGKTGEGTIGRANLDGSAPEPNFITGASNPCGLAVDGAHIYWSDTVPAGGVGRANLDGTGVNQTFVATNGHACGVAVDGANLYWANRDAGTIGRANLDGNPASVNQSFITGGTDICGVTVDGAHVYWADRESDSIGRADLDGNAASVNPKFISGASNPCGLAVDSSHIYWANSLTSAIGSANLDGSGVNQSLIAANIPCWVATDLPPLPLPPVRQTRPSPTSRSNTKLARPGSASRARAETGRSASSASWTNAPSATAPPPRSTNTFGQGNTCSKFGPLTRAARSIRPRQARDSGSPTRSTRATRRSTNSRALLLRPQHDRLEVPEARPDSALPRRARKGQNRCRAGCIGEDDSRRLAGLFARNPLCRARYGVVAESVYEAEGHRFESCRAR